MDTEWMRQKLAGQLARLEGYLAMPVRGQMEAGKSAAGVVGELRHHEPAVRQILRALDPGLVLPDIGHDDFRRFRDLVVHGLGLLDDHEGLAASLAPDGPVVPASQFHGWVWDAARPLWSCGCYRLAVQAAATSVSAHAQARLGRRDVADGAVMAEAFATQPPQPGRPRLRCPAASSGPVARRRQRGALQFAAGCYAAIRDHAASDHGEEWDQQAALECLAAFSVLARWIERWELVTAP